MHMLMVLKMLRHHKLLAKELICQFSSCSSVGFTGHIISDIS